MTGPRSPPLASPAAVSRRRPPFCFSGPWHCQHFAASRGRTFFSNWSAADSAATAAAEKNNAPVHESSATFGASLTIDIPLLLFSNAVKIALASKQQFSADQGRRGAEAVVQPVHGQRLGHGVPV